MIRFACMLASVLVAGCDGVFGVSSLPVPPDAPPNELGCATRTALLCADFEQGDNYYADGIPSALPLPVGNVTDTVDMPGSSGTGHALYVSSSGDVYRVDATSTTPASTITVTLDLELAHFDANSLATTLVVLYFENVAATDCYVALNFVPSPMHLGLVGKCPSAMTTVLITPLPSGTGFVPITVVMDLPHKSGSATLYDRSATVTLDPGTSTTGTPGVGFGINDKIGPAMARVGFDHVLAVTTP